VSAALRGRVALVTGASRGIGRAVAQDLAAAGMRVVGTARPSGDLDALGQALGGATEPGFVVPADLRDEASVGALFAEVDARAGALDVLVNNAGIARVEPFLGTTFESWRAVLATNLDALFLTSQQALHRMLPRGSGHLVFVGSDASLRGIARMAHYAASKHALLGLARSLAVEFRGSGVRVTTVMPGSTNTTILFPEANRPEVLQPVDVAETVRYALSLPPRAEVRELLVVEATRPT
jgi:3-oxoacyl-[acyl-carrier protein] reductase